MLSRSILIIDNNALEILSLDLNIGRQIQRAIGEFNPDYRNEIGYLARVLEVGDGNLTKLVILGKNGEFDMTELAELPASLSEDPTLELLKLAADSLGYELIKKN
ncbi:MAG: hypothetical protein ACXW2E_01500 [Nitrososphaeraceae archaeon]